MASETDNRSGAVRLPDFYIIGHAKSGTTALYEILLQHPQIFMPEYKRGAGKEPWYFSRDNPNPQTNGVRNIEYTGRKEQTLDDYLSLFSDAREDQLVGEASTSYIWSPTAAQRIAQARPDAKIIAIIREPASFLRSLHLQLLQNHHETELDFRRAVELDGERLQNRSIPERSYWPRALIYSERVRYVAQLERYRAVFSPEQMLVLIYDDFRADNLATARAVFDFLGVDTDQEVHPADVNPTVGVRSVRVDELRRSLKRGDTALLRMVRDIGKRVTTLGMRERIYYPLVNRAVFGEPPPPDEAFNHELRLRFKGEVESLSDYLGRDLVKLWGYDALD